VNALWAKGLEAAEEARMLLAGGKYDGASSRAYYSMFNVARALLEHDGVELEAIKTHATVLRLVSLRLVRQEVIDKDLGRAFRRAAETRQIADYDMISVTEDEARDRVAAMERLILVAQPILMDQEQ
jgi:uncharacterized protein